MVKLELTEEEVKEGLKLLKAVIKPLERSIAAVDLGSRDYRQFLNNRKALVDELVKRLERTTTIELTDEEARESLMMLKEALPELERSIARTDLGSRDYRQFLHNRKALVDELIKRLESNGCCLPSNEKNKLNGPGREKNLL